MCEVWQAKTHTHTHTCTHTHTHTHAHTHARTRFRFHHTNSNHPYEGALVLISGVKMSIHSGGRGAVKFIITACVHNVRSGTLGILKTLVLIPDRSNVIETLLILFIY